MEELVASTRWTRGGTRRGRRRGRRFLPSRLRRRRLRRRRPRRRPSPSVRTGTLKSKLNSNSSTITSPSRSIWGGRGRCRRSSLRLGTGYRPSRGLTWSRSLARRRRLGRVPCRKKPALAVRIIPWVIVALSHSFSISNPDLKAVSSNASLG